LFKYEPVFLDFQESFLDEFFVDGTFGAGVIVKGSIPSPEELCDFGVVAVCELFRLNALSDGFYFDGCAVCI
jgi:hypothetical protein